MDTLLEDSQPAKERTFNWAQDEDEVVTKTSSDDEDSVSDVDPGKFLEDIFHRTDSNPNASDARPESLQLQHEWVFWYDDHLARGMTNKDYQNAVRILGKFSTVQEFWRYWNNLSDLEKYPVGTNLRLFKTGIKPMWEDPANTYGGSWVIQTNQTKANPLWSSIVLAAIGEQFEYGDSLCGMVLSIRKDGAKMALWNRDGTNAKEIESTTETLKQVTGIHQPIKYKLHQGSLDSNKSLVDRRSIRRSTSATSDTSPDDSPDTKHRQAGLNPSSPSAHRRSPSLDRRRLQTSTNDKLNLHRTASENHRRSQSIDMSSNMHIPQTPSPAMHRRRASNPEIEPLLASSNPSRLSRINSASSNSPNLSPVSSPGTRRNRNESPSPSPRASHHNNHRSRNHELHVTEVSDNAASEYQDYKKPTRSDSSSRTQTSKSLVQIEDGKLKIDIKMLSFAMIILAVTASYFYVHL